MTATYAETLPTDRDWLRHRIDDVGPTFFRENELIDALLVMYPDRRRAAAEVAQSIGLELAKQITQFQDEDGSVSWAKRSDAFFAVAKTLLAELADEAAATEESGFAVGSVRARREHDLAVGEYSSRPVWAHRRDWY